MNAWDLTLELVTAMHEIDLLIDSKSRAFNISERELIDKEIDRKEVRMFELKNILRCTDINK